MAETMSFDVHLSASYDEAVEQVTAALKEQGFGVLTRVDIHKAFKEKLGVDFRPYSILGACNPPLAHKALSAHAEVGLLLPCNVTVEADPAGGSQVRLINPNEMMNFGSIGDDEAIKAVASDAYTRLKNVADALAS